MTPAQTVPSDVRGALAERARICTFLRHYSENFKEKHREIHFAFCRVADAIQNGDPAGIEVDPDLTFPQFDLVLVHPSRFNEIQRAEQSEKRLKALEAANAEALKVLQRVVFDKLALTPEGAEQLLHKIQRAAWGDFGG